MNRFNKGFCQNCRRYMEIKHVTLKRNFGAVVIRREWTIEGNLCRDCIKSFFWNLTLKTLVFGWWGIKSFFITIAYIIGNIIEYIGSLKMSSKVYKLELENSPDLANENQEIKKIESQSPGYRFGELINEENSKENSETKNNVTQKDNLCPNCGRETLSNENFCPYCGKKILRSTVLETQKRKPFLRSLTPPQIIAIIFGGGILSLMIGLMILPYIFERDFFSNPVDVAATSQRETYWVNRTNAVFTQDSRSATSQVEGIQRLTNIAVLRETNDSNLVYGCVRWDQVTQSHVGKKTCVFGKIAKINHNDYGNGTYEYVVRFKESDDYFLVKSENYWWPEIGVGQCWYFEGLIQYEAYYFMKKLTLDDVVADVYSNCN